MRPPTVLRLNRQIVLEDVENGFVVFKESLCDGFDIEGFFVTSLDFEGGMVSRSGLMDSKSSMAIRSDAVRSFS